MSATLAPSCEADVPVVHGPPATRAYLVGKRALDVVVATVALLVLAPLMVAIAVAILFSGGRPVLFRQERIGARPCPRGDGCSWELRPFTMLKFRTMTPGAEREELHRRFVEAFIAGALDPDADATAAFKLAGDRRVTRLGRLLRATSLDELPQLLNVLAGQMSLVGPRPVPGYEVAGYAPRHLGRLAATPGMTGLWQVHGRGRVAFEEMVRMDLEYVSRRSVRLDVALLLMTPRSVASRKGAR